MLKPNEPGARYGMVINLDRCLGCGTCMAACAIENNVSLTPMEGDHRRGLTWMKVAKTDNKKKFPNVETVRIPIPCQQCENPPCLHVCPATAVGIDHRSGIVTQIPARCVGCRYCLAACPYHARFFNWWDVKYPSDKALNPDVSPRMRGVVEKCNFCHGRYQTARETARLDGEKNPVGVPYVTACTESCPSEAITFGNLEDPESTVSKLAKSPKCFRLLETARTETKVYYYSKRAWVRDLRSYPGFVDKEQDNG
jgi:Fe-S-cluster-containing dehydrogenase component